MAYVVVSNKSKELIFKRKPHRITPSLYYPYDWTDEYSEGELWWNEHIHEPSTVIELPKGSIEKLLEKRLTNEDNPIELKDERTII